MELKLESGQDVSEEATGSNRTFMELKLRWVVRLVVVCLCSNRTFMELKWNNDTEAYDGKAVLIVPLWN